MAWRRAANGLRWFVPPNHPPCPWRRARSGTLRTPAHHFDSFKFHCYAPYAFRLFRKQFGIDSADFLVSLCDQPLRRLSNPGASGSLFFLSQDDQYIIKTVDKHEAKFLARLLPGYYMNLVQNKRTLLPKFYGLFEYKGSLGKRRIRVIVMNNILPTRYDYYQRFDLKGSTWKRAASRKELQKKRPCQKDLDWKRLHRDGIRLEPGTYANLADTIQRDSAVLESFKIMDYSILVGIHRVDRDEDLGPGRGPAQPVVAPPMAVDLKRSSGYTRPRSASFSSRPRSGHSASPGGQLISEMKRRELGLVNTYPSAIWGKVKEEAPDGSDRDVEVVIFCGIIDILQSFVLKKQLEHRWKMLTKDGDACSVHRPGFYKVRFDTFLMQEVFKASEAPDALVTNEQTAAAVDLEDPELVKQRTEKAVPSPYFPQAIPDAEQPKPEPRSTRHRRSNSGGWVSGVGVGASASVDRQESVGLLDGDDEDATVGPSPQVSLPPSPMRSGQRSPAMTKPISQDTIVEEQRSGVAASDVAASLSLLKAAPPKVGWVVGVAELAGESSTDVEESLPPLPAFVELDRNKSEMSLQSVDESRSVTGILSRKATAVSLPVSVHEGEAAEPGGAALTSRNTTAEKMNAFDEAFDAAFVDASPASARPSAAGVSLFSASPPSGPASAEQDADGYLRIGSEPSSGQTSPDVPVVAAAAGTAAAAAAASAPPATGASAARAGGPPAEAAAGAMVGVVASAQPSSALPSSALPSLPTPSLVPVPVVVETVPRPNFANNDVILDAIAAVKASADEAAALATAHVGAPPNVTVSEVLSQVEPTTISVSRAAGGNAETTAVPAAPPAVEEQQQPAVSDAEAVRITKLKIEAARARRAAAKSSPGVRRKLPQAGVSPGTRRKLPQQPGAAASGRSSAGSVLKPAASDAPPAASTPAATAAPTLAPKSAPATAPKPNAPPHTAPKPAPKPGAAVSATAEPASGAHDASSLLQATDAELDEFMMLEAATASPEKAP